MSDTWNESQNPGARLDSNLLPAEDAGMHAALGAASNLPPQQQLQGRLPAAAAPRGAWKFGATRAQSMDACVCSSPYTTADMDKEGE